jgi:hypothetical protein
MILGQLTVTDPKRRVQPLISLGRGICGKKNDVLASKKRIFRILGLPSDLQINSPKISEKVGCPISEVRKVIHVHSRLKNTSREPPPCPLGPLRPLCPLPEFRNGTPGKLAVFGRIDAVQLSKTAKNVSRNEHQERKGEKRSLWSRFFVSFEALRMEK